MKGKKKLYNNISYIKDRLSSGTYSQISRMLNSLNPSDIAHFIESSPPEDRDFVWQILNTDVEGEVLNHLSDALQEQFLKNMDAAEVAEVTESLETDEIADIIQRMPEAVIEEVLSSMSIQNRVRLEEVLSYPDQCSPILFSLSYPICRRSHSLYQMQRTEIYQS